MKNTLWIKKLKKDVKKFLDMISEYDYKYIRYSLTGDIYNNKTNWGLGQAVFMVKILYMLDMIEDLSLEHKSNLVNNIKRFQDKDGYISDPLVMKLITKKKFIFFKDSDNEFEIEKIRRAETRQSFSALNCLGVKPDKPFLHVPYSMDGIKKFLSSYNWKYPWDAGSHFSHLMFFLNMNRKMFDYRKKEVDSLIGFANEWVDNIQSKKNGFWYSGKTNIKEKINGAMKVLTGKTAADILEINNLKKLVDSCLSAVNDSEACSNFNIVYCLYYCSRISEYRKKDIEDFCYNRLEIYRDFYYEDIGGFSFYKRIANDIYYGARISRGLSEPDIHGTVLFIWGIALISKILELDFTDFKIPLT